MATLKTKSESVKTVKTAKAKVAKTSVKQTRITSAQKAEQMKIGICETFGITQENLNAYALRKALSSSKRTNELSFFQDLGIKLLTNKSLIETIK